ncbi:MAG TPA: type II secretion system minor pseudopilin GspK [Piscinibacter sp.]|nr:type II secretion system minor pseudopilin GspK [Piscinibacter sp.]
MTLQRFRWSQHHHQRGAAVILALLTVALVAGLAAAALADLGVALEQVTGRHDQAQARQLARGAVDWARNVLAEDARTSQVDHFGETWAVKVPPTPVEEGQVSGELQELSGRFNLNNLVQASDGNAMAVEQFQRMLAVVGVGKSEAMNLTAALLDWLDADDEPRRPAGAESAWYATQSPPRRPANGPLVTVSELLQVRGFTPQLFDRLTPLVTALPPGSMINVNTAPPEILAAVVPGMTLDTARVVAVERNRAWFKSVNDFKARLPSDNSNLDTNGLAVSSRYFLATGRARFGVAMVRMEVLLDRRQNWSTIVWQKLL